MFQKISVIAAVLILCLAGQAKLLAQIKTAVPNFEISKVDNAFLEDLSRRSF